MAKLPSPTTEKHDGPAPPQSAKGRAVLIAAFPISRALPVPPPGERVGRDWLSEYGVSDAKMSREHVAFGRPGGVLHVTDVGSQNGTFVNGHRIDGATALPDGAVLRIGRTLFVLRDRFLGSDSDPSPPMGRDATLVGPFGLRRFAAGLAVLAESSRERKSINVLIEGETGTGKELAARVVAEAFGRARPFGAINVSAIPDGTFESQLFGYVPGAFSGAGRGSKGFLLEHDGGAVLLDELGELPLDRQARVLRLLQEREIVRVGGTRPERSDLLVIGATNRPLEEMVRSDRFRRDLLARFAAGRLTLPPLRNRPEDLFAIAQALMTRAGRPYSVAEVEVEAIERLMLQSWPGNVRELEAVLQKAAAAAAPPRLMEWTIEEALGDAEPDRGASVVLTAETVRKAMASCADNTRAAATKLGVSRGRLLRWLEKHPR